MQTKKKSILDSNVLYTVIAIIVGFIIGAIFLAVAGISPSVAYGKLIDSVFGKPKYLVWTLIYASPIILTGLSVAFSFRTGVFNIGAEGQFVVGAMVATVVGILVDVPAVIHVPLCLIASAAAGALWSWVVGLLKVKRGIHEVLSFIMFNWIAFYLSNYVVNLDIIRRESGGEASKDVLASARILFPEGVRKFLDCSAANWGVVLAIVIAIINSIIQLILEKLTIKEKAYTKTQRYLSYSMKLTLLTFCNSALVPYIAYLIWRASTIDVLSKNIFMIFLTNSFLPIVICNNINK